MEHPKAVGDRTTMAVMLALVDAGFSVFVPFGENTRADFIIDDGARLARVQCKTGRLRGGAVRFATCSCYGHHRNPATARRDYHGQIDFFAVYCPETAGVYLIPISDLRVKVQGALRVTPPRNNQARKVRLASDYEIGTVRVSSALAASAGGSAPSA
jgi:PD-(D/E)XK endonuclease